MHKENLSLRNAVAIMFCISVTAVMLFGFSLEVKQDTWIAILLSAIPLLPIMLLYARLIKLMPCMDIYEMAHAVFGNPGGKITTFLFMFYCLHMSALALGNYAEFAHLTSLFQTPFIVISLLIFIAVLYLAKSGVEILGKWCALIFALLILSVTGMGVAAARFFEPKHLLPIMNHSWLEIGRASFTIARLPILESVIILSFIGGLEKKEHSKRLFLSGAAIAIVFIAMVFIRTCGILGPEAMKTIYFPNYKAASLVQIGTFLERIEAFLAFFYILAGVSKISAGLIGASRGVAKLFNLPSYNFIVLPVGMSVVAFSAILFHGIIEQFDFMKIYPLYVIPFQLIIPIVIWITAEIKAKRHTLNVNI
ncbi:MAG: endospore germination permease [Oscillospiraceae bacterium]|jgi:spore germination protein KB|nr:endospore germination permease [Oscillospiraceae bacterium]